MAEAQKLQELTDAFQSLAKGTISKEEEEEEEGGGFMLG
jgi:hypothetical protein